MVAIPFAVSSAPGIRPQESGGRLINCYAEKAGEGARFPVIWRRSPGLRQILSIATYNHLRGGIVAGSTLIVALDTRVLAVTESGGVFSAANLGALAGTDPITVAKNNAGTANYVCVTTAGCFNLFTGSAPTAFVDSDLPQPNSVSSLHGYFLWTIGDGRIFASDLNAVTVASNAYTTEQSLGGLLRGVTFRDEFFAFGPNGAAVYRDVGASPFPLERQTAYIKRGLAGTHAIAGWEDGWSSELLWAADDGTICRLNGYTPDPVSNDDVTRDVAQAIRDGEGADLEASAYMNGKHALWVLTNPGVWTWEYNFTTQNWTERKTHNQDDWQVSRAIHAFDRWIVGSRSDGLLYEVDQDYHREGNSTPLVMELYSGVPPTFPARGVCMRADFDFTVGVGMAAGEDPVQTDPSVLISHSVDGGASWSNPVTRKLGAQGNTTHRVSVLRVGKFEGQGVRFRIQVSDPVHVGFCGAQMAIQQRAA